ncbi:uncharacterized protein LOC122276802 [Carya illinoinensis]|uniref:uncharacterized protein LOC122276802 n=1 Tax=Carya illinoinensis TaxID=32201 RepID=UPI001C71CFC6|nr:uncharacterized protein LOC122276802 [Carya illinoinensis]
MEKNVNIIAADDKDRTDINLDNELGGIWGTNLPDNGGNFLDGWNGTANNQESYDLNVEDLRETLANTDLDAAAAAFRNSPTRLNAATSLESDIEWRETLREAATDLDAAAAAARITRARWNACIQGLQIRGRGETVNREGRVFKLMNDADKQPVFNKLIESANVSELRQIVAKIVSQPESLIKASLNPYG